MATDNALVARSREHKDYQRALQINAELAELDRQMLVIEKRIDVLKEEQDTLDPYAVGVVDFDLHNRPK